MDLAWIALVALALVVLASCFHVGNPGVVALTLAWLVAAFAAPRFETPVTAKSLNEAFPAELFLILLGVSLLFAQAETNGTLARVASAAQSLCRGRAVLVPPLFFVLTAGIGTVGPGNIASAGLFAPVAMATAHRAGIPPLVMALMVGHGAIVSGLSPFTAAGRVVAKALSEAGLEDVGWRLYAANLVVNAAVAAAGFLLFGGRRLIGVRLDATAAGDGGPREREGLSGRQILTLVVVAAVLLGVVLTGTNIGSAATAGAALLFLARAADERESFAKIPWSVIVMVCGVSTLAGIVERAGGTQRFADLVGRFATPETLAPVVAFGTGIVSIYSSTTGVVLPVFLPMAARLAAAVEGAAPLDVALAVLVGGNLVDVSPLSTVGALCLAGLPIAGDRRVLFRGLLLWGFAMAVVAAFVCAVFL